MAKKTTTNGKIAPKKDAADKLKDFMVDGMKDLYWAEKALVKNLPKMAKNATSKKLKDAVNLHLDETKDQVKRLEDAFKALKLKPEAVKCDAMDGLLKEAEGIMEETEPGAVRDAAIIAAAQKVEHYEIASYGTLATYAKLLGEKEVMQLLLATLNEEKSCDKDLTKLAKTEINLKAK
ncbi:ferritin-like domain-containing protein [Chryseobacterium sp.]|uniref:YciE/YciF ferroxidase family protein n=1 Tax=Chryseobacterium sp. TaxID=1871047 RepID=UPI0011CCBB88|nr:ferritin-like domain-containing protein [Chryseobacterium sp.]TXF79316.1 ferritin-like domain-containing protein [Chryseobacterium sp.]